MFTIPGYDNVDNTSSKSFSVKTDNVGPVISHAFGTSWLRKEEGLLVYPSHTVLFIIATDAVVGFQRMTYILNNETEKEYKEIIILTDWDRKGGHLCQIIRRNLKGRVNFNTRYREFFTRHSMIRTVEGLPSWIMTMKDKLNLI